VPFGAADERSTELTPWAKSLPSTLGGKDRCDTNGHHCDLSESEKSILVSCLRKLALLVSKAAWMSDRRLLKVSANSGKRKERAEVVGDDGAVGDGGLVADVLATGC